MVDRMTALLSTFKKRLDRLERRVSPRGFSMPAGTVLPWAGSVQNVPAGYVLCNGATYQVAEQGSLFRAIGTTYGQDGTGTFRVPDLRSRVPVGVDTRDADFNTHGRTGGTKTHTLTVAQMPVHDHDFGYTGQSGSFEQWPYNQTAGGNVGFAGVASGATNFVDIKDAGGGQSHPNLQPYIALNYIIKL